MTWFLRTGSGEVVRVMVDGAPLEARAGESVATALLAAGHRSFARNAASGALVASGCTTALTNGVYFDVRCE